MRLACRSYIYIIIILKRRNYICNLNWKCYMRIFNTKLFIHEACSIPQTDQSCTWRYLGNMCIFFCPTFAVSALTHYGVRAWKRFPHHWLLVKGSICFTMTSQWARWRLKSPASRLFAQRFIQAQIKESIKAPRHWPLWWEFTGDRWISRIKGQ